MTCRDPTRQGSETAAANMIIRGEIDDLRKEKQLCAGMRKVTATIT